ncbi:MAG: elongation factor P [Bacilli bacterium]|jgi:elongation factor P|nr:elongation factor P [Bacilli bacterium]
MINVNDFKTGVTIMFDGNIYQVLEFLHVKPGKGSAFVRSKLKNLRTGSTIEHTFNSGIKVERAMIEKKTVQYLYNEGETFYFMDMETYDQIPLDIKQIGEDIKYLKENLDVELIYFEEEILGINLPEKVELLVTKTEPAVRGNTATNALKEAILETSMVVKVPLFIEEGETIIISTKDGKYVSRK